MSNVPAQARQANDVRLRAIPALAAAGLLARSIILKHLSKSLAFQLLAAMRRQPNGLLAKPLARKRSDQRLTQLHRLRRQSMFSDKAINSPVLVKPSTNSGCQAK